MPPLTGAEWALLFGYIFQAGMFYAGMKNVKESITALQTEHDKSKIEIRNRLESHDKQDDRRFLALVAVLVATAPNELKMIVTDLLKSAQ